MYKLDQVCTHNGKITVLKENNDQEFVANYCPGCATNFKLKRML